MWVYMQMLREKGELVSTEELAARPPNIGWLRLAPGHERWGKHNKETVLVDPVRRDWTAVLNQAEVTTIRADGLHLIGVEEVFGRRGSDVRVHPQEWRCWPVDCDSMRMNVVALRERGTKLGPEAVRAKAAEPLVGCLSLGPGHARRGGHLEANVVEPSSCVWLGVLYRASVKKVEARGMVIVGVERVFDRRGRDSQVFRQAWWCWPVAPGETPGSKGCRTRLTGTERMA